MERMRIGLHDLVDDRQDISIGMLDGVKTQLPVTLD